MERFSFLFPVSFLIQIIADVIVLFVIFPAYKLTKNRAFLCIAWACLLGLIGTICNHTISLSPMSRSNLALYTEFRCVMSMSASVLYAVGTVLLTQWVLELLPADAPKAEP